MLCIMRLTRFRSVASNLTRKKSMEVNIPPVVTVIAGAVVVGLCFALRIPIFLVGVLALVLLAYTIVLNRNIFDIEYENMTFAKTAAGIFNVLPGTGIGSLMLTATIVILSLGYIIYLFGLSSLVTNAAMSLPRGFTSLSASSEYSAPQSQYKNYNAAPAPRNSYVSAFNRAI